MSTEAMTWAIELAPPMPAHLVGTLVGLATHADAKGRGAYPSLPRLAAYACKADRSVRRDLRELQALGLIRPGDPRKVAHLPPDKRPEVYDLALERAVPGGRAGPDEGTRTSARTLASARARGGKKNPSSDAPRRDVDVRADVDVPPGRGRHERADVDVTTGGTPTSAKPSVEPSVNRHRHTSPTRTRGTTVPADFAVTDAMRTWATGKGLDRPRIDRETERFLDHHRAKGSLFKDWTAAWRTWMSRSLDYTPRGQQPERPAYKPPLF